MNLLRLAGSFLAIILGGFIFAFLSKERITKTGLLKIISVAVGWTFFMAIMQ